MRIAIIGGQSYLEEELEDFLYKLHTKYPDAVIVTGNGRGAEKAVTTLMEAIGHTIEIPPLRPDLYDDAKEVTFLSNDGTTQTVKVENRKTRAADCQITDILLTADVIVIVGGLTGSRASVAAAIWKRVDSWREKSLQRPFHNIAAPKVEKKQPTRKAKKKIEQLAA